MEHDGRYHWRGTWVHLTGLYVCQKKPLLYGKFPTLIASKWWEGFISFPWLRHKVESYFRQTKMILRSIIWQYLYNLFIFLNISVQILLLLGNQLPQLTDFFTMAINKLCFDTLGLHCAEERKEDRVSKLKKEKNHIPNRSVTSHLESNMI